MQTLRQMISKYIQIVSVVVVVITLVIVVSIQFFIEQRRARESAEQAFYQMEQLLKENQQELQAVKAEYRQTCLRNAQTIAYILEHNPEAIESTEELRDIAELVEVDEIHIFDASGRIYAGTNPEYFNLTFDSGEQIGFFKPLLEDKSLELVQDITPNTAEAKQMQYSALWSENKEFIVQVGMEPVNVMKITEKNELSYLFSMFRANADADYYAIDANTGEIVGSTILEDVGKKYSDIGLKLSEIERDPDGFHEDVKGVTCFCVFKRVDDTYIGRVIPSNVLYQRVPNSTIVLAVCLFLVAHILAWTVTYYMNKYVIEGIRNVNDKLRVIGKGDLDARVDVQNSTDFAELSVHINDMVKSILDGNHRMSYILSKTNMYIGVYQYNEQSKKVRFTEYIPKILRLDDDATERLGSDYTLLQEYLSKIYENPVPGEEGVFQLSAEPEHYVRLEEITENNQVFGVAIDVTEEICKLKRVEVERDIDTLTGLYNRRGLENQLKQLYETPSQLGFSAFIMLDADGLKGINDKYGHDKGDIYLKKVASVINNFGIKSSLASRLGGDEFVLFLYEYEDEEELLNTIKTLEYIQNNSSAKLGDNISVPLCFSMGYCMGEGIEDYQKQLKTADERMYENKRQRKEGKSPNQ